MSGCGWAILVWLPQRHPECTEVLHRTRIHQSIACVTRLGPFVGFRVKAKDSVYKSQPDDTHDDQIKRDDIIQKIGRQQNKNAGDQRHDWLDVTYVKGHNLCLH
jgi:hypothetical protein